jgi:hypothetical protein
LRQLSQLPQSLLLQWLRSLRQLPQSPLSLLLQVQLLHELHELLLPQSVLLQVRLLQSLLIQLLLVQPLLHLLRQPLLQRS